MEEQKSTIWIIIASVLLVVGLGYYIFQDLKSVDIKPADSNINIEGPDGGTIEIIPVDDASADTVSVPPPDLNRSMIFSENFPEDLRETMMKNITDLSNALRDDPDDFSSWIDLGINRKIIGDYEGAREVWEYAGIIRPTNNVSFNNLGDLYGYYLKDNKKAKESFSTALENGPNSIWLYFNVAGFYKDIKEIEEARAIVQKGIELNPSSEELEELLSSLE